MGSSLDDLSELERQVLDQILVNKSVRKFWHGTYFTWTMHGHGGHRKLYDEVLKTLSDKFFPVLVPVDDNKMYVVDVKYLFKFYADLMSTRSPAVSPVEDTEYVSCLESAGMI